MKRKSRIKYNDGRTIDILTANITMLGQVYRDVYLDVKPIGQIVSIDVKDDMGTVSFDYSFSDKHNIEKIEDCMKAYREYLKEHNQ